MIRAGAKLSIQRIPLAQLVVTEQVETYPAKFAIYLELLTTHPEHDVDPLIVKPSAQYTGIYEIDNGKHRFCSSIMAGRRDALCLVVEEVQE